MERDRERDELLENAVAPTNIECLTCRSITSPETKFLHTWGSDNKDRVLFMYKCPNGCLPMRSFFEDGTEYRSEPKLCPKCRTELENKNERENKDRAVIIERCPNCNYSNKEVFDLKQKKEKPDKNFAKDISRFCITDEQGKKYLEEKSRFKQMMELAKEIEEKYGKGKKEKKKPDIKALTLPELEKLLGPAIKKAGYIKFKLGEPQIDKDVIVSFQVQDGQNRAERESSYDLKKLLKKTLNGTNWHLMSDGVYYKLGVLSGRLRGKEGEDHS